MSEETKNTVKIYDGGYGGELNKLNQKMEKVLYKEIQRNYSNAKEIIGSL